jgi:hypothetical protein
MNAVTAAGNIIPLNRVRFDRRGIPFGGFDWLSGDSIVSFIPAV